MLSPAETRSLLDQIDTGPLVGLRDRALLSVMVYSFARVSAAVGIVISRSLRRRKPDATIVGEIGRRKDLMSTTFRPYAPDQSLLFPPDVREWLPEGHLAHHVSDLVDGLDLTAFYVAYAGDGRRNAPYEPRMMVKVLLYAYATGVFSSRRVARKLEEDVAFRVLAAGNFPQHRTLCEFRRRHLEDFQALFVEVVRLAQELGLARLGKLSIDGTKVRANASKHKAMSYDRMQEEEQRLESEIEALLRQADAVDEAEDARLGAEIRGDDLPAELHRREARLAAIRAAKSRLEAKQRAADDMRGRQPGQDRNPKGGPPYKRAYGEPDEKAQSNFTDPESSIMKTSSEGFQQCYKPVDTRAPTTCLKYASYLHYDRYLAAPADAGRARAPARPPAAGRRERRRAAVAPAPPRSSGGRPTRLPWMRSSA